MARPTPKSSQRPPQPFRSQPETVDPIWLVKAIAITAGVALICSYLALCLLFYQGQWQIVLHPSRTDAAPKSINGVPYQLIHFGPDESAIPQLTGWWIPAAHSRYANATLLVLPSGDGSLADSLPTLSALHSLGIDIFAFDYRGYGQSVRTHPNQQKMTHDADSAWQYLTSSRAVPANQIIPYGIGVGASLAVHLAADHATIPALILDHPHTDLLATARRDPRSRLIPLSLLFHENFPLAEPLKSLSTPKLLLSSTASNPSYGQSITGFLDQHLPGVRLVTSRAPTPK
jgi:pimeloyl-ACP methyl ester carboxylesterase